ncbi:MAG: hypothetical protein JXA30_08340 [Deltaproteobacteria bacterium]|nr:hypothetical protein [Deltaproteobacteria bacterium]
MTENLTYQDKHLAKAEELFSRGSFQAAKKFFEKAGYGLERDEIAEKLRICNKEIAAQRAKELIKKARRCLAKGRPAEALALFIQAHGITGEAWLEDRISGLRRELQNVGSEDAASTAEAAGDYLAAADLYGRLAREGSNEAAALRRAHCLVMAAQWADAVEVYQGVDPQTHRDLYEFGLAMAMTGRYYECLKHWAKIPSEHADFIQQKRAVCALLASDSLERLETDIDHAAVLDELKDILRAMDHAGLKEAVRCYRNRLIALYWRDERYDLILKLLDEIDEIDPVLLEVAARASFLRVSESASELTASQLDDLTMYWLTALNQPETWSKLSTDAEQSSRLQARLIERAEALVKNGADLCSGDGERIYARWKEERSVMEQLRELAKGREHEDLPIYTPRFASRFGRSAAMLELIRSNRESIRDTDRYLTLGAYYSGAAPALFLAEDGCYEQALQLVKGLENQDEFTSYAALKIEFEIGLNLLEMGDKNAVRHIKSAAVLLTTAPGFEERIAQKAAGITDRRFIELYEKALGILIKEKPSPGLNRALSTLITTRAVMDFNRSRISVTPLSAAIERALELDPDNEAARIALSDAQYNRDFDELNEALEKHKMTRACQIVERSEHEGIYDAFFEFMEDAMNEVNERVTDKGERIFMLNDLYKWCQCVDCDHPLVDELGDLLDLEQ